MECIALADDERQPCEIWTRVMGYHRPVSQFNPGKQGEHAERLHFIEDRAGSADIKRIGQWTLCE